MYVVVPSRRGHNQSVGLGEGGQIFMLQDIHQVLAILFLSFAHPDYYLRIFSLLFLPP